MLKQKTQLDSLMIFLTMKLPSLIIHKRNLLGGDASNLCPWRLKHRLTEEMFEKIQFLTITLSRRFDYVY